MEKRTLVLIVDDEERNLRLLESVLVPKGYEIAVAHDGGEALAKSTMPGLDAILLDVMMPTMDGFEVCRRLKADARTAPVPVLLVTSLDSRSDRLLGIEAGATDFISKPIDREYLLLKLKNAVYAKSLFNTLEANFEKLRELEQMRDKLTNLIVHDLRTPLFGITGNLELLKIDPPAPLAPNQVRYVDNANLSAWDMLHQVNAMLAVNRSGKCTIEVNLNDDRLREIALEAVEMLGSLKSQCTILVTCRAEPISMSCDRGLIRRVIVNLLSNAVRFTAGAEMIRITITAEKDGIRGRVEDVGASIPEEYQEMMADFKNERRMYAAGFSLAFCTMAVEAHGGEIGVDRAEGGGCTFWFFLPCKPADPDGASAGGSIPA